MNNAKKILRFVSSVAVVALFFVSASALYGCDSEQKDDEMNSQWITASPTEHACSLEGELFAMNSLASNDSAEMVLRERIPSETVYEFAELDGDFFSKGVGVEDGEVEPYSCNNNYCRRKCGPGGGNYLGAGSCACCIIP